MSPPPMLWRTSAPSGRSQRSQESWGLDPSLLAPAKEDLDPLQGAQVPGPRPCLSFPTLAFTPLMFPTSSELFLQLVPWAPLFKLAGRKSALDR